MMALLMQKVKVKIENQLRRSAETRRMVYLRLADNDTVPISVWRVGAMRSTECRQFLSILLALLVIYVTINFTRLSVTTEVGALYGHFICGWLGVVWGVVDARYGVKCAWLAGRGRCAESRPELETLNK